MENMTGGSATSLSRAQVCMPSAPRRTPFRTFQQSTCVLRTQRTQVRVDQLYTVFHQQLAVFRRWLLLFFVPCATITIILPLTAVPHVSSIARHQGGQRLHHLKYSL